MDATAAPPTASVETEDANMADAGASQLLPQAARQPENNTIANLKLEPASSPAPFLDDDTAAASSFPSSSRNNSKAGTPQPTAAAAAAASVPPGSRPGGKKKAKKGTATTVKAPKKTTGGPRSKGGRGPKRGAGKSSTSTSAGPNKAASGSESEESDHGPYCLCRGPDDHRWMISCEACEDWFHGECINVTKEVGETLIQSYICPLCTVPGKLVTRYKKSCGLAGCTQPARISAAGRDRGSNSVFCSQDHCNLWWEQLIATLPKREGDKGRVGLTQPEFAGLLLGSSSKPYETATATTTSTATATATATVTPGTWFVGQKPFAVPEDFWDRHDASSVLTPEEADLLATSAAARRGLADEVVLCRKMLQLLDMAAAQRLDAVAAGRLKKDGCGYDSSLDHVGVQAQFAAFAGSPAGRAALAAGRLDSPTYDAAAAEDGPPAWDADPAAVRRTYLCPRSRCKPHYNWHAIHARHVHFLLKELAAEAKARLDTENRVRANAAVRYFRKKSEFSAVVRFDQDQEDDDDDDGDGYGEDDGHGEHGRGRDQGEHKDENNDGAVDHGKDVDVDMDTAGL